MFDHLLSATTSVEATSTIAVGKPWTILCLSGLPVTRAGLRHLPDSSLTSGALILPASEISESGVLSDNRNS